MVFRKPIVINLPFMIILFMFQYHKNISELLLLQCDYLHLSTAYTLTETLRIVHALIITNIKQRKKISEMNKKN